MEMQRPPERSFRLPFLREVQEARRCHGSASEETIAPGSPKLWGGKRQSKAEPDNCPVLVRPRRAKTGQLSGSAFLFLSGPEEQKLRFQGADHSAALRGPFRPKSPKELVC